MRCYCGARVVRQCECATAVPVPVPSYYQRSSQHHRTSSTSTAPAQREQPLQPSTQIPAPKFLSLTSVLPHGTPYRSHHEPVPSYHEPAPSPTNPVPSPTPSLTLPPSQRHRSSCNIQTSLISPPICHSYLQSPPLSALNSTR